MRTFADFEKSNGRFVICDFVCPTKETRANFNADIIIWMDTIKEGRFEDTNKLFQNPDNVTYHITEWNDKNHINIENIRIAERTKKYYTFIIDISINDSEKLKFLLAEMKTLSQVDKVKRQSFKYQ